MKVTKEKIILVIVCIFALVLNIFLGTYISRQTSQLAAYKPCGFISFEDTICGWVVGWPITFAEMGDETDLESPFSHGAVDFNGVTVRQISSDSLYLNKHGTKKLDEKLLKQNNSLWIFILTVLEILLMVPTWQLIKANRRKKS